jgi:RNA polymerase sigma-70 factor (ECF subfamily)
MKPASARQDRRYREAALSYGTALGRLAMAYERDPDRRRDLLQEIHLALWCSFSGFEDRCSLRTWVYRVAHNTATAWVVRQKRWWSLVDLDDLNAEPSEESHERAADRVDAERLVELVEKLKPDDRQIMLLYLEGFDSVEIGEVIGIGPGYVRTRIHRIKKLLARRFLPGGE